MSAQAIAATMTTPHMELKTMSNSKRRLLAGRFLSGWAALFFLVDGGMKLFKPSMVVEATLQLGYPESAIVGIGVILLACTILYLIRGTAILGAILLTGYLGGAVATHARMAGPWFNILFPVVFGCFVWGGLWLRDQRLQIVLAKEGSGR